MEHWRSVQKSYYLLAIWAERPGFIQVSKRYLQIRVSAWTKHEFVVPTGGRNLYNFAIQVAIQEKMISLLP